LFGEFCVDVIAGTSPRAVITWFDTWWWRRTTVWILELRIYESRPRPVRPVPKRTSTGWIVGNDRVIDMKNARVIDIRVGGSD
tara:strand:- start:102 stop:350 length:249 start_codon:yes stop_codon:yes gene_type:complete